VSAEDSNSQRDVRRLQGSTSLQQITYEILSTTSPSNPNYTQTVAQQTYLQLTAQAQALQQSLTTGSVNLADLNVQVQSVQYSVGVGLPATMTNGTTRVFTD
jgi:uncharacterized protein (DUF3084 family)